MYLTSNPIPFLDRASKSLSALRPILNRKPVAVTPTSSPERVDQIRKHAGHQAQQLRKILKDYDAPHEPEVCTLCMFDLTCYTV